MYSFCFSALYATCPYYVVIYMQSVTRAGAPVESRPASKHTSQPDFLGSAAVQAVRTSLATLETTVHPARNDTMVHPAWNETTAWTPPIFNTTALRYNHRGIYAATAFPGFCN